MHNVRILFLIFCLPAFGVSGEQLTTSCDDRGSLAAGFLNPPPENRPSTFWHWMNGNVTREGITRDLEAMQRVGIGGVMIFDGSTYLPPGPAGYLNPHWRELMTHTLKEGDRLGLDIGMHNGPGWSSSGGPWIQPEMAMQQLVWTETTVTGGQLVRLDLPRPQMNLDYYRDACVVAFPSLSGEEVPYEEAIERITSGGRVQPTGVLSDGQWDTTLPLHPADALEIEFTDVIELYGLSVQPSPNGRLPKMRVEVSVDGKSYQQVCTVRNPGGHGIHPPAVRQFPATAGRYVRLIPEKAGEAGEIVFYRTPRIKDWVAKSNLSYRVVGQMRLPEDYPAMASIDPASVVDLTDQVKNGHLQWMAPAGQWTILRIGHTPTGKKNVAASAAGSGLESDKLNPEATTFHFNQVIGQVKADAAEVGAKGPDTLTIDSYEAGLQNWTADFPEEFKKRTGYDIIPYLPALFGRIVGSSGESERFLFDFRRVQARMVAEYYYDRMEQLAHQEGMRFYVEGYGTGNFDELEIAGLPDVPTAEFWIRTPWTPNRPVKMVTSAANIYGKPVVAAESFTGEAETSRWLEYPYAMKSLGDDMFAQGVNHFVFHRYAHQPHPDAVPGMTMGPWGFHMDRTNTWFEQSSEWLDYLQRCQFMLRQGTVAADVLYFTGEKSPDSSQFSIPVLPAGYTYDLVNADVLLHRMKVENGAFVLPEGNRYHLLVLPNDLQAMSPSLANRLYGFAEQGAMIIGPQPVFSPTLVGYPDSEKTMLEDAAKTWSLPNVHSHLSIAGALSELDLEPDFTMPVSSPDASVSWQHRKLDDGDLYFISNRQRRPEQLVVSLRGMAGRHPQIWRPETGEISSTPLHKDDKDRLQIPFQLESAESVFLVLPKGSAKVSGRNLTHDGQPIIGLDVRPSVPPDESEDFTMSMWVKPDTNLRVMPKESTTGRIDEVGKFYAIPADPGDIRFGKGHATAGLAVGRNGIFVIERSSDTSPAVLVSSQPVSGWTHVAVVYRNSVPELFVNGKFVRKGLRSGMIVHSGVGSPPPPVDYTLHFPGIESITRSAGQEPPPSRGQVYIFEGNFTPAQVFDHALSTEEISAMANAGIPDPEDPVVSQLDLQPNGATEFLAWRGGKYELDGGPVASVEVVDPETLTGPWKVVFQPGRGAPDQITLQELESLHLNDDFGVKHFSGTATYLQDWIMSSEIDTQDHRIMLDLGRVEVVAKVMINGHGAGLVWKEPYRLDITDYVQPGTNRIEIAVTDLWTNRLIGDESLPRENEFGLSDERGVDPHGISELPDWYLQGKPKPDGGRVTFSVWRFYEADEPLVASGLLGPVRILQPVKVVLPGTRQ